MSEEEILHYAKIFSGAIGDVHKLEIYQGAEKKTIVEPELWEMVIDLLSKKDKEIKELDLENQALFESIALEDDNSLCRKYEKMKKIIELMATDLATDYHSKEWVINYYMEKINESIRNNTIQACKSKNKI
jgi:hypothetical protein